MNLFGFTPGLFEHLERQFQDFLKENVSDVDSEFYIPTVVDNLIKNNQASVKVLKSNSRWLGITNKEDKKSVIKSIRELISRNEYPQRLWA